MDKPAADSAVTSHLLERLRAGDAAALGPLLARHREYLRRAVASRLDAQLAARVDAEDVVQETQLEATRRIESYLRRTPMPFRTWLRKTAHERLIDIRRRHAGAGRRAVSREVVLADQTVLKFARGLSVSDTTPSRRVSQEELAALVRRALAALPAIDREVLLMRTVEGLSYDDVGHILEIEPAAARKRHGRALLRLHTALSDLGHTESQA